jgi:NAD(P)-dependent dehydrogenase (short-subunit alcohol dehydrogenase family)
VTSSALPLEPIPELFALSLAKAAQRNLVRSLYLAYGPQGVHVGVINAAGVVTPDDPVRSPAQIAARAWEWAEAGTDFEVVV